MAALSSIFQHALLGWIRIIYFSYLAHKERSLLLDITWWAKPRLLLALPLPLLTSLSMFLLVDLLVSMETGPHPHRAEWALVTLAWNRASVPPPPKGWGLGNVCYPHPTAELTSVCGAIRYPRWKCLVRLHFLHGVPTAMQSVQNIQGEGLGSDRNGTLGWRKLEVILDI